MLLITDARVYPQEVALDVRVRDGRIAELGGRLRRRPGEHIVDAGGGALLPGLHDHHLHLYALAAQRSSVFCGPPEVTSPRQLARALAGEPGQGWLRGIGYHESVAGPLDRLRLDALTGDRPVRIQHASGIMWFVNSAAAAVLDLAGHAQLPGVEVDAAGVPTGRLFRMDGWLRQQLGRQDPPDLARVSAELGSFGVTGVTDTSPQNDTATAGQFAGALNRGSLRQRLRLMGSEELRVPWPDDRLVTGELKVMLDEPALPELDGLVARIRAAHGCGRGVAFHCVTRTELVFALCALGEAGPGRDRIEHASVAPLDIMPLLSATGVTVVTQPGLIAERGDRYLAEAEPADLAHLYRLRSFLEHGVPLGLSSDAPYGSPDPWRAMRAAVSRATREGRVIGEAEALTPEAALHGFLTAAAAPGGAARGIRVGATADLCLLDRPWSAARELLDARCVVMTLVGGRVIHQR